MKRSAKKILSLFLCAMLCVSLLPAAAFAENEVAETEPIAAELPEKAVLLPEETIPAEEPAAGKPAPAEAETAAEPEPAAEPEAEAAVDVDAAPPQAARLSAIAPATNIERNRFILIPKSSSNALVLLLYRDKGLNCASRIPHLARFCKGEGRFFAQCRNAFSFRCAFCANRANKKSFPLSEKLL